MDPRPRPSAGERSWTPIVLGLAAVAYGAWVARYYAAAGLTLAHYDAKAHLVVARRIIDSITPGYQQIGAVWLPLPHLLNTLFVQYDPWFRSGISAVVLSVGALGLSVFGAAALVQRATASNVAAAIAALLIALNPNLLYLQSTPMTEPLLLGVTLVAVWKLFEWVETAPAASDHREPPKLSGVGRVFRPGAQRRAPVPTHDLLVPSKGPHDVRNASLHSRAGVVGMLLALACLTRYEAWPIVFSALAAAAFALWRSGRAPRQTIGRLARIALYPLAVVAGFIVHSRITVGEWFVGDFYTPDNPARHDAIATMAQVWWGVTHLSGSVTSIAMVAGAMIVVLLGLIARRRAGWLLLTAPLFAAAVPWLAFFRGHPYRIRYIVPVVAAGAIPLATTLALLPRRWRIAVALVLAAVIVREVHPLDRTAPMVVEAQWDRPNSEARKHVIDCLTRQFRPGEKIMASMGSLAHFMQETSSYGLAINDYLHEGNGDIWLQALISPRPYVEWILIQEYAEGGDMLSHLAHEKPTFLAGFEGICDGGGVVLYRRNTGPSGGRPAP